MVVLRCMASARYTYRRFGGCYLVFAGLVVLGLVTRIGAGPPPMMEQFDPAKFLEQMFGKQTEAERRELDKVTISWAEEQKFGNRAARAFLDSLHERGVGVLSRGRDVQYLQRLLQTVQPLMHQAKRYRRVTVYLADSKETDARSFPGGTIVIFRDMLDFAQSEAAMVGVLAHELSHMDHGHQLQNMRAMKLAQQTFQPGSNGMNFARMMNNGMALMRLFSHPFRPEDEAEADRDGATWAYHAGYDPREMAAMFLRLHQRDHGVGDAVPMFLRTHPYRKDRYEAVMKLYQQLQTQDPQPHLYVGRTNLKRRIPRGEREFKE